MPLRSRSVEVASFIDGALRSSDCALTADVINPSNGKRLFAVPMGCEADVNRAVKSARRAFEDGRWSQTAPSTKRQVLGRLAELIAAESDGLDSLDAEEMGKPVSTQFANARAGAEFMRFCGEAVDKVTSDVYASDPRSLVLQRRVPRGVVAAVVPWNFPTSNAVLKVAPALAAGNSVVLKPSELSSRSALDLAELAIKAGLPEGVFNVVPGLGNTVGKALGLHNDVDMIAFTGSTGVGRLMLQYAGNSNMKVVQAECGGKSPQILFADGVGLDEACESIAGFLLTNQGQICSVGSRVLVQRPIEAAVIERLTARLQQVVMGDAQDPRTTFGPLVSQKQCERVLHYIASAEAEGAERVTGGARVKRETGGYFVEPTLFRAVSPTARIAQEEIFGPVLSVLTFDDEAEAIRIANSTSYGLAAYLWTSRLDTGMRVSKALRSMVFVNPTVSAGEGAGHASSWEPSGLSGIGPEGGFAGLEYYLRRQLISFAHP